MNTRRAARAVAKRIVAIGARLTFGQAEARPTLPHLREPARLRLDQRVFAVDAVALVEHGLADDAHHLLEVVLGAIDRFLRIVERALHVEEDLASGEIRAEVAGEGENHFELADLVLPVQPRIAGRTGRFDETFALVKTERLWMDVVALGDGRD